MSYSRTEGTTVGFYMPPERSAVALWGRMLARRTKKDIPQVSPWRGRAVSGDRSMCVGRSFCMFVCVRVDVGACAWGYICACASVGMRAPVCVSACVCEGGACICMRHSRSPCVTPEMSMLSMRPCGDVHASGETNAFASGEANVLSIDVHRNP